MADPLPPTAGDPVDAAELEVARAVARAADRTVYGVREPGRGRRLSLERPPDPGALSYVVRRDGVVTFGPAGRPTAPAGGEPTDPASIPPAELRLMREQALVAGRTVYVAARDDTGTSAHFAPPLDGTLRYAVRVDGTVLVGRRAYAERPSAVTDASFLARVGAEVRQLRRLVERAASLAGLPVVDNHAWAHVERLLPEEERQGLRAAVLGRMDGDTASTLLAAAAERRLARLRAEAGQRVRAQP